MQLGDYFIRFENFGGYIEEVIYYVVKVTPKGCRVCKFSNGLNWNGLPAKTHLILTNSNKKFAYPVSEREVALKSFFIRKQREIEHLIPRFTYLYSILESKDAIEKKLLEEGVNHHYCEPKLATNHNEEILEDIRQTQINMGYMDTWQNTVIDFLENPY